MASPGIASVAWFERLLYAPGDDEETRRRKVQFTLASILVAPAGLIWGALYFAFGEKLVAAIPTAYPVLTALGLAEAPARLFQRHLERLPDLFAGEALGLFGRSAGGGGGVSAR